MSTHEYPKEMIDPGADAPVAPAEPMTWEQAVRKHITDPAYAERLLALPDDATAEQVHACAPRHHAPVASAGDKPATSEPDGRQGADMTAPRCWKCNDNSPCDLPHCGLKEDDAPTLPAMSEEQIAEALGLNPESPCALGYYAIARAIITARDAQWAQREQMRADMSEWQPISTAPTDGRTILLGRYNELGKWRTMRGQWMSQDYIDNNWEDPPSGEPGWFETCVEADEIPNCWPINPTHWMPLPGAPEAA